MRTATNKGPCQKCGGNRPGLYWKEQAKTLDFGLGVPMETPAVGPLLCDECEGKRARAEAVAAGWGHLWAGARI